MCATHLGFSSQHDSRTHGCRIRLIEWSKAKSKALEKHLRRMKVPFHLTREAVDRAHPFVMLAIGSFSNSSRYPLPVCGTIHFYHTSGLEADGERSLMGLKQWQSHSLSSFVAAEWYFFPVGFLRLLKFPLTYSISTIISNLNFDTFVFHLSGIDCPWRSPDKLLCLFTVVKTVVISFVCIALGFFCTGLNNSPICSVRHSCFGELPYADRTAIPEQKADRERVLYENARGNSPANNCLPRLEAFMQRGPGSSQHAARE